jgi:hypothetical protein
MLLTEPTWRKMIVCSTVASGLQMRDKRRIYHLMRVHRCDENTFLPHLGMTLGSFCTWQLLGDKPQRACGVALADLSSCAAMGNIDASTTTAAQP